MNNGTIAEESIAVVGEDWYIKSAATFGFLSFIALVCSLVNPVNRLLRYLKCGGCFACQSYNQVRSSAKQNLGDDTRNTAIVNWVNIAGYTLWWFSISIGFTVYNKWLLNDWHGGSVYPATFSCIHMFVKGVLAFIALIITRRPFYRIGWRSFWLLACPVGFSTGMDVVLANISLVVVTMSFYTLVKSTTLIFILGMVLCFRLDKFSWWLMLICIVLVAGLVMTSFGETEFDAVGLFIAILSMFFGSLRWVLAEVMLHNKKICTRSSQELPVAHISKSTQNQSSRDNISVIVDKNIDNINVNCDANDGNTIDSNDNIKQNDDKSSSSNNNTKASRSTATVDPLNLVMLIAPASFLSILPFVLITELPNLISNMNTSINLDTNISVITPLEFVGVASIGGILSFLLILVEIMLVKETSSLTLSVLGVLKTLLQVLIAIFLFGDDFGLLKAFGMVMTLSGLLGYAFFKRVQKKKEAV